MIHILNDISTINILGVRVHTLFLYQVLAMIQEAITTDQKLLISHLNIHGSHLAYQDIHYRNILNHSDIVYCDGMGIKLAARILGKEIPERFTLADWYPQLITMAQENDISLFFLGAEPQIAKMAAQKLSKTFPGVIIVGTQHGFFNKTVKGDENKTVVKAINDQKPDILLVGMGMPIQEQWLAENWHSLDVNVAISCGAIFEYMAGVMNHGPTWMTQNYLEWLFRLFDRPDRYAKRYLLENPLFFIRIIKQRFFGLQI